MSVRAATRLSIAYVIAGAVAMTFPGLVPVNRTFPLVLGLPFAMFWVAAWAVLGFFVLVVLERAVSREEAGDAREDAWNAGN